MKIISIIGFAFLLLVFSQCDKRNNGADCVTSDDCNTYKYDSGYVYINTSYMDGGAGVPVILYKGYVEDNNILWADTVYETRLTFWLPIKSRYAAEGYYRVGQQLFITLDGKKLKDDTYEDCGTKCYQEPSMSLDLKKI